MGCLLCFSDIIHPKPVEYSPKLLELCRKYLHSTLTEETIPFKKDLSLCPKCNESAMQLVYVAEQMSLLQQSITDIAFIFSLGILHRRGKIPDVSDLNMKSDMNIICTKKVGFDISPNSKASWKDNCSISNATWPATDLSSSVIVVQKPEEIESGSMGTEELVDPLLIKDPQYDEYPGDSSAIDIKHENYQPDWIEENTDQQNNIMESRITNLPIEDNESAGTSGISITRFENNKQIHNFNHLPRLPSHLCITEGQQSVDNIPLEPPMVTVSIVPENLEGVSAGKIPRSQEIHQNLSQRHSIISKRKKLNVSSGNESQEIGKLFRCDVCNKAFATNNKLVVHRRIHTGELPYKCDFCDKRFNQKSNMITHNKRVHVGEKPFQCSLCRKTFSRSNMQAITNHHCTQSSSDRTFKYTSGKEFTGKSKMKRYRKNHT